MNKTVAEALYLANGLVREFKYVTEVDIAVCPPFTALAAVSEAVLDSNIRLGAQNMSEHGYGAHTGETAAGMLKEFSTRYVILGHSERRQYQRESDELVAAQERYYLHAIELFGPERCMFESNFPVDKVSYSYNIMYNAFKLLTKGFRDEDRKAMLHDNAATIYKI